MQTSTCYVCLHKIFHPLEFITQVKAAPLSFPSISCVTKKCFNLKWLQCYHTDKTEHYKSPAHLAFSARRSIYADQGNKNQSHLLEIPFSLLIIIQQRSDFPGNTINILTDWVQQNFIREENTFSRSTSTMRNRKIFLVHTFFPETTEHPYIHWCAPQTEHCSHWIAIETTSEWK